MFAWPRSIGLFVSPLALGALVASPTLASDLFIYSKKGQSQAQQDKDRFECHTWSVNQTGFDPTRAQVSVPPPPEKTSDGGAVRGAARGAAVGAIGGAIGGDAGKGAAIGAGVGAAGGGMRRRSAERAQAA